MNLHLTTLLSTVWLAGCATTAQPPAHVDYTPSPENKGSLFDRLDADPQNVMEVVLAHKGELAACLSRQHTAEPSLHGSLKFGWLIEIDGTPSTIEVVNPEFADSIVVRCVTAEIATWRWASRQTGKPMPVSVPLKF